MNRNLETSIQRHEDIDDFDLLFGDYGGSTDSTDSGTDHIIEPRDYSKILLNM